MKLVVIMGIEEHAKKLRTLLAEKEVLVFSELEMKGFRRFPKLDSRDEWFTHGGNGTYSHLLFTVTESEKARELLEAIRETSASGPETNPIHAFVANVEEFI